MTKGCRLSLSQKCQYAVRAILELSKRYQQGAVPASEVAAIQAVPQRFLEVILNELKPTGLVESRRGVQGGFYLTVPPKDITVGQVIRMVEGPLDPVRCMTDPESDSCPLRGKCSLIELWDRAKRAVEEVYDSMTFQDLVDREAVLAGKKVSDYCI
jgi:Rrf2 family transcriptional regulator, cysteine metabolism repressor